MSKQINKEVIFYCFLVKKSMQICLGILKIGAIKKWPLVILPVNILIVYYIIIIVIIIVYLLLPLIAEAGGV